MTEITIKGLDKLVAKFKNAPKTLDREMNKRMKASLEVLHEKVPPYIPQVVPPEVYKRQGTLGKSLGVTPYGDKAGKPTVYSISGSGKDKQGRFGTNLSYAKYVIDAKQQAYMHKPGYKGRPGWWTMKNIKENALPKIQKLWDDLVKALLK